MFSKCSFWVNYPFKLSLPSSLQALIHLTQFLADEFSKSSQQPMLRTKSPFYILSFIRIHYTQMYLTLWKKREISVNASSRLYALWIAVICQFAAPDSRRHSRTVSVDVSDHELIRSCNPSDLQHPLCESL